MCRQQNIAEFTIESQEYYDKDRGLLYTVLQGQRTLAINLTYPEAIAKIKLLQDAKQD